MISVKDDQVSVPVGPLLASSRFVKVQSFTSDSKKNPFFLTQLNGAISVLSSIKPRNQLFQLTGDGHILSQIGNKVLDLDGNNNVILNKWNSSTSSSNLQIWVFQNNYIINKNKNLYLDINNDSSLSVKSKNSSSQTQQWYFGPTFPLVPILQEKPLPFPAFTGDQENAYVWISEQVGNCKSLRTHYFYVTLVPTYASEVKNLQYPTDGVYNGTKLNFSSSDFSAVQTQLITELNRATSIINLFEYYNKFHQSLFSQTQALLSKIETAAGLESGSTTEFATGWIITLFTGLVCTIIDIVPEVGPPIANLIQTGVDVTVEVVDAYKQNVFNADPFQVALYGLWDLLINNFNILSKTMEGMLKDIVMDWGKMTKVYQCMQLPPGPASLCWTATTNSESLPPALQANGVSLCQMLLPSKYQIYVITSNGDKPSAKIPSFCKWKSNDLIYYIAANDSYTTFPTSELMNNEIWSQNVTFEDFFTSKFGWNFPIAYVGSKGFVTPTFSNNSSIPMKVNIQFNSKTTSYELHTYSSFTYIYDDDSQPELDDNFTVTINDLNGNQITTFKIAYDSNGINFKNDVTAPGYQLGTPIINGDGSDYSSSINVPINAIPVPLSLKKKTIKK
ncbi:hypothetical protein DICPUDRAFT_76197 [Dictyostelium purpureum]|uniref:Ricin B lectin domain-containing protein n=1 Tax=Dictyostelium purpureum TaxID=5786 RepID=F0ZCW4_DICPU|nr:uncharacterized protein DICPUDRAFT_76197 [Dictyostelium purpureum]EGC38207.1 hypothetical protein DICPUDRAFT_76197 [Dictyostelium purpureum]|eukprot:XP_003285245.1 hypothetical protein DICPUDRAFT_76197 [Dictyostelium purpureum]